MSFLFRRWLLFATGLEKAQSKGFGQLAYTCAKYPRTTIAIWFFGFCLLLLGIMRFHQEASVDNLWVDVNGVSMRNSRTVENLLPSEARDGYAIFVLSESNATPKLSDIVNVDHVQELFDFHTIIANIRTSSSQKSLFDLCVKLPTDATKCTLGGVLRAWNFNQTLFAGSTTDSVKIALGNPTYLDGGAIDRFQDMAGFTLTSDAPPRASASAFTSLYLLRATTEGSTEQNDVKEFVAAFKAEVNRQNSLLRMEVFYSDAVDEALSSVVGKDIVLMIIAFILMISFTSLTLGRPFHAIEGRALLASAAVILVVLSSLAGYCLCFAIGLPFTNLQQILPFLLIGLGIDDAYIVVAALDHTSRKRPLLERIRETYEVVGVSITVTSLTDVVAFSLSMTSRLPAVRYFGVYAACSIGFIYISFMTIFAVMIAWDETRRANNKLAMLPCKKSKVETTVAFKDSVALSTPSDKLETVLTKYYIPCLLKPISKVIVLAAFLALTGAMGYQVTKIDVAFPIRDLLDSSTSPFRYVLSHERLFGGLELPQSDIGLYFQNLNYSDGEVLRNIQATVDRATTLDAIRQTAAPRNWLKAFALFTLSTAPYNTMPRDPTNTYVVGEANFYSALNAFISNPVNNFIYGSDLVFADGKLVLTRVMFTMRFVSSTALRIGFLKQFRDFETTITGISPRPFFENGNMALWEMNAFMINEAVSLFSLTLAMVAIITAFTLVHPGLMLIVIVTLGLIFINILGFLPVFGMNINAVSVTNLVMGIGIVVDASAHITHSFGQQDASLPRDDRVKLAMREIGGSVLMGAFTTFLGVLPTAGASSEVFRVFFKCFVIIVVLGAAFGMIWLPVILSIMGPSFGGPQTAKPTTNDISPANSRGDTSPDFDDVPEKSQEPRIATEIM